MTRNQAIEHYLSCGKAHRKITVERLMKWNPLLSIRENANKLGINYYVSQGLCREYKLGHRFVGKGNNYGRLLNHRGRNHAATA